jgi:hypothetical protein
MAPEEPITDAGNTKLQYLLGSSASASRMVAMMIRPRPERMMYFGLNFLDSEPEKLSINAAIPTGSMWTAVLMTLQW